MKKILVGTHNKGKFKEISFLIPKKISFEFVSFEFMMILLILVDLFSLTFLICSLNKLTFQSLDILEFFFLILYLFKLMFIGHSLILSFKFSFIN